jgi:hypothetical protein
MVSLNQVEKGIARYLDTVVAPKLPTAGKYDAVKKIAFMSGAMYLVKNSRVAVEGFLRNPMIAATGIINDSGEVDIDGLVASIKTNIPDTGIVVPVPFVGEMKFYAADADVICRHIKEAQ